MTTTFEVRSSLKGLAVGDVCNVVTSNRHSTRTMFIREAKALGWTIITRSTPDGLTVRRIT